MPNPEEFRRTRRIVDLLLRVANQPKRWTRRDLATRYEVSEQQMDKDLQLVRHGLVMPLRHCRQGYYFESLPALPTLTLSLSEALSLLLAARLGQQMPGVSRTDLAAAIARLETLLPPRLLPVVGRLAGGDDAAGSQASLLWDLQLAIADGERLRLLYRSASHDSIGVAPGSAIESVRDQGAGVGCSDELPERLVDPYTLLPYLKSWYLIGFCHLRGEVRVFKVSRIERATRTGEQFTLPKDFDLAVYQGRTWGLLWGEAGDPEEVVVEFTPDAGRWVRDEQWHPGQRVDELPGGRVRLCFQAGITPELRRWVLGFGRQARVIRPESLARWVMDEVAAMAGSHAGELLSSEVRDGG
jgi:predicted DNA-binding transcriptional regulator YafY